MTRIARQVADNDSIDIFDLIENEYERGNPTEVRLSDDINLAWKQIGTGFRKWILRYISDCGGQKNYAYHTNRLAKVQSLIFTQMLADGLCVDHRPFNRFFFGNDSTKFSK